MARSKRYHQPGSFYHVMLRGNNGQDIFFSDNDRVAMCLLLQEGIEKFNHSIHAFCFMNNHIHLLIQVQEITLSKIMQNIAFRYSQKLNRNNKRIGHLFQGRFKAILIDEEAYFTRLLRYIHMNCVRANITNTPEDYAWSSHNSYLGTSEISWVTTKYGLSKFSNIKDEAIYFYSLYIQKNELPEDLEEIRSKFREGYILGNDQFIDSIKLTTPSNEKSNLSFHYIVEAACQILEVPFEFIHSPSKSQKASFARCVIAKIANETSKITIEEIATLLKRDGSTISSLLSRFSKKLSVTSSEREIIEKVKSEAYIIAELQA